MSMWMRSADSDEGRRVTLAMSVGGVEIQDDLLVSAFVSVNYHPKTEEEFSGLIRAAAGLPGVVFKRSNVGDTVWVEFTLEGDDEGAPRFRGTVFYPRERSGSADDESVTGRKVRQLLEEVAR